MFALYHPRSLGLSAVEPLSLGAGVVCGSKVTAFSFDGRACQIQNPGPPVWVGRESDPELGLLPGHRDQEWTHNRDEGL